ncbi:2-polyprenyl-3-methyl-5-hydroxy-6-metoxy-1,4-benzoquinol methylase [Geodermatophilus bullaregiensis]|uniref:class I SAM-dependent methyltransferase n=1 Tax=Geodermatophilus bullaregiensis TaxID=1564160 RepID=UPI00195B8B22|nr:class I SAM-dependent methyltransferase [Geodermatophilus bullaregiensis]MBM7804170.1 2-polyprenyl-3-methyl-5-hydroxy-6-metoxy-1,4-benzoquinol methylase [Geodermatophilus bullaregiensis]
MITRRVERALVRAGNRGRRLLSILKPYEPMGQGKELLDSQYASAEWDYLRSIGEAPRFGVVSAYCRLLASGGSILEIGCGEGILLEHLDRGRFRRFAGVDISSVAVDRARVLEDDRTTFTCADAEAHVPDRAFDLVVFNEVLEYFDDPLALVRRYEPFVEPGGHFIVSMFAGIHTARTRSIWRWLESRYAVVAHTRVATHRDHLWNVKVLRVPTPA